MCDVFHNLGLQLDLFKRLPLLQGFIQALLVTSFFHEGLSFMTVGHNTTCVSTLALAAGVHMGRCNSSFGGPGEMSLEALAISLIPGFQIVFPCIVR